MTKVVPALPTRYHYGTCRTCSGPYIHAGLDRNYCSECGWVSDTEWTQQQLEKEQFNSKPKRRTRS